MGLVKNPFADRKHSNDPAISSIPARGKVVLNMDIYKTIIATTIRYANARIPEEKWVEVYGLLYGYNKDNDVIITEAVPFTHTVKKGHILKVEFDQEDYALAADLESQFYMKDPPQFIVGWYHSHPGIKVMMSQDDVKTQLAWQTNNPLAVALVFNPVRLLKQVELPSRKGDPVKQLKLDPGYKIFRLDNTARGIEARYHEIPYEFSDVIMDDKLILNAQEFGLWTAKAFPREDAILTDYKAYIDKTNRKLADILSGTREYTKRLIREGQSDRVSSVVDKQIEAAQYILDQGNTMVSVFRMMSNFLEYKERETYLPRIDAILTQWDKNTEKFVEKLEALKYQSLE